MNGAQLNTKLEPYVCGVIAEDNEGCTFEDVQLSVGEYRFRYSDSVPNALVMDYYLFAEHDNNTYQNGTSLESECVACALLTPSFLTTVSRASLLVYRVKTSRKVGYALEQRPTNMASVFPTLQKLVTHLRLEGVIPQTSHSVARPAWSVHDRKTVLPSHVPRTRRSLPPSDIIIAY